MGCAGGHRWELLSADDAWQRINHLHERGRYLDSIERLEIFMINHMGSPMVDSAQFLLADCHFQMKQYIVAAAEYEQLIVQFPQSSLVEQAEYQRGECYFELSPRTSLDQTYTAQTIEAFQEFIEMYPNSDLVPDAMDKILECRLKLAQKDYESGRLYHNMGEYSAARIYYDSVMENFYDTPFAAKAQYYKSVAFMDSRNWQEAISEFSIFLERYSDHEWSDRALRKLNEAREHYQEELEDARALSGN